MLHARPHLYFSEAVCYNKTITFDRKQEQPMRTKREQIIFQAFHDQICRSEFSSGLTLFFGLHGNSSIRYQSAEYSMPAGALLVVNPFELYQVTCSENAEVIAMQIPEN